MMMVAGWKACKLGDVLDIIGGGTPKTSVAEYWNGDIPWLSVVDFNHGHKYVAVTEKSITNLGFEKSSTKMLNKGDIIISARGTVGALAVLSMPMAFNQSCYGLRANQESTNEYIYYLTKNAINELKQVSYGAVFDTITKNTFNEIDIILPPLSEQKAIAEVLSSLDDKIDLLHRQNKTLEEMAQTLFREWFVEKVDEGWEQSSIDQLAKISSGKSLSRDKFIDGGAYKVLGANGQIGTTNEYLHEGKLIFTGRVGTLGNVFITDENDRFWLSDNTLIINPSCHFYFTYHLLKSFNLQDLNVGSTQPLIRQSDLKSIEFLLPSDEILNLFENEVESLYKKINLNLKQIKSLEQTRDELLPKLMSGEVRVTVIYD